VAGLAAKYGFPPKPQLLELNGMPAIALEFPNIPKDYPSRITMHCEVGEDGRISRLYYVVAPSKLAGVPWPP
jgi:hypothetical protein